MSRNLLRLAVLIVVTSCMAQSRAAEPYEIPTIELPAPLQPYADAENVIEKAVSIIRLLGTAKFNEPPSESPLSKAPCNTADISAFYRGMTLMQTGYFIFINKMERGFEAVDSPHFEQDSEGYLAPAPYGALVKPGRELLVAVWDGEKRKHLLELVAATQDISAKVKADLVAYFTILKEFGRRYSAVKRRVPLDLARLIKRSTYLYELERGVEIEWAKKLSEEALRSAQRKYPERLLYEDYAREMRLLLNANRDIGMDPVSECFDGGYVAVVQLGEKGEITYRPYLAMYPASYMIGFWQRRESEGTSALARFAIDRLLDELKHQE